MLFHAATRQPPFVGEDAASVVRQHLRTEPPVTSSLRPDLPPSIDHLLLSLLAKTPSARPASAIELLELLQDIASSSAPTAMVEADDRDEPCDDPSGTEPDARSRFVLVSGERGIGKSALIRQFLHDAALSDIQVFEGCSPVSGARAMHAVTQIVFQVSRIASRRTRSKHAWVIERLTAGGDGGQLPADSERLRIASGIRELLNDVAIDHPVILYFDGLGDADEATNDILAYLLRNPGSGHLMCIGELTTGARDDRPRHLAEIAQRVWSGMHLERPAFNAAGTRDFVMTLLGGDSAPPRVVDWIAERAGVPSVAIEVLCSLLRRGLLQRTTGGFVCHAELQNDSLIVGAQSLIQEKFRDLTDRERLALNLIATAVELPTNQLATLLERLAGHLPDADRTLDDLMRKRLVRVTHAETQPTRDAVRTVRSARRLRAARRDVLGHGARRRLRVDVLRRPPRAPRRARRRSCRWRPRNRTRDR